MQDGAPVPGVAAAAVQEARHAAGNIVLANCGASRSRRSATEDKGSLVTIGPIRLPSPTLDGSSCRGLWRGWPGLLIHVMLLIGFRNRFIVVFQWAWSFWSYYCGARLITGPLRRAHDEPRAERRAG